LDRFHFTGKTQKQIEFGQPRSACNKHLSHAKITTSFAHCNFVIKHFEEARGGKRSIFMLPLKKRLLTCEIRLFSQRTHPFQRWTRPLLSWILALLFI